MYKIEAFDHCELYVSNAKQAAHFYQAAFGFKPVAYKGLETGSRDKVSYVLKQDRIIFVISSPLGPDTAMGRHIDTHGDGVKDVSFTVDNAELAWQESTALDAESVSEPALIKDQDGEAVVSTVKTFGDTTHTFVERNNYSEIFMPGFKEVNNKISPINPGGIPHGPQPGKIEESLGVKETDELAVMIDTFKPLSLTEHCSRIEDQNYPLSWSEV